MLTRELPGQARCGLLGPETGRLVASAPVSEPYADEQLAAFLAEAPPAFAERDVAAIRAAIAERARSRPPGPDVHEVRDVDAGGTPARLYRPAPGPLPVVLSLHGGGWSVGNVASHDRMCRRMANASGVAILSLEYRLAPEHPWPASVDDTVAALRWIHAAPDALGEPATAVGVMGDSAGATLAALACLRLRDEEPAAMPRLQVLVYGNFDLTAALSSQADMPPGGGVDAETERWFISQWVPDQARHGDPDVSPLYAPDLSGLPPTVIVSAALDSLRLEADAFAERLRGAGIETELRQEAGMVHNFLLYDEVSPACAAAADRVAADLRERLAR